MPGYCQMVAQKLSVLSIHPVRPEDSCGTWKITVMESLNDRKLDNLPWFGKPYPAPVWRILV